MPITAFSRWLPRRVAFLLGLLLLPVASGLAQVPQPAQPGKALPSPDQAKQMLQDQPALVEQLRQRISQSGLTPDQVRSRLRALGYPEDLLDQYLQGADTTALARPSAGTLDAVRALGILSPQEADSLGLSDSLFAQSDSVRHLLDSLRMVHLDSLRADSLSDSLERIRPTGLRIFGLTTFRKLSNQFDVPENGPVDENYQLGPGDVLVLIMTGDVERADMLEVTREGFVVIPQVGSIYVANITMGQLEDQLYTRLGRVYSGVRRSPNARTKFQVSIARLRNIQVFVAGDVVRPGSYQISAAGTVLNALYAAGGPTTNGSFRRVEVRRGGKLADSVDVYEYLTKGMNPTGARLQSGDVVFVPVHGGFAKVVGKVNRPAIYEMLPNETLRDAVSFAGGFDPTAVHARITINRVVPPASRAPGAPTRVVVAVGSDQFADGMAPALPMAPGDSVTVQGIEDRLRGFVTVRGNVWVEGQVGFTAGMKLSDAIRLAGGPKPRSLPGPDPGDPGERRLDHDPAPVGLRRLDGGRHRRSGAAGSGRDPDLVAIHLPERAVGGGGGCGAEAGTGPLPGRHDAPRRRAAGRRLDTGRLAAGGGDRAARLQPGPAAPSPPPYGCRWTRPICSAARRATATPARPACPRPPRVRPRRRSSPMTT